MPPLMSLRQESSSILKAHQTYINGWRGQAREMYDALLDDLDRAESRVYDKLRTIKEQADEEIERLQLKAEEPDMTIRLNINDLHALARQFRYSHQRISDLIRLLNRHFHVLFSSVKTARTCGIDQAQSEMEHELKGFLHTLDDLQHLLHFTEIRMKKTDQMLAEKALSQRRAFGRLPADHVFFGCSQMFPWQL